MGEKTRTRGYSNTPLKRDILERKTKTSKSWQKTMLTGGNGKPCLSETVPCPKFFKKIVEYSNGMLVPLSKTMPVSVKLQL